MKTILLILTIFWYSTATMGSDKKDTPAKTNDAATVVLSGTVTDQFSGESLAGVEVQIEGTGIKTYTDFDGNFSFENVQKGDCKLVANYISYEKESCKVELSSGKNEVKIKLQASR